MYFITNFFSPHPRIDLEFRKNLNSISSSELKLVPAFTLLSISLWEGGTPVVPNLLPEVRVAKSPELDSVR